MSRLRQKESPISNPDIDRFLLFALPCANSQSLRSVNYNKRRFVDGQMLDWYKGWSVFRLDLDKLSSIPDIKKMYFFNNIFLSVKVSLISDCSKLVVRM